MLHVPVGKKTRLHNEFGANREQIKGTMSTLLHPKHFTLNQARTKLMAIIPLIKELVSLKKALNEKGFDAYRHTYFGGSGPNGERYYPKELERLVDIVKMFSNDGIQVKGLDQGLIDFPYVRENGEEVYLCFLLGEDDILFWHSIDDGFPGRRPIDEL
jgi:hypothetical protein